MASGGCYVHRIPRFRSRSRTGQPHALPATTYRWPTSGSPRKRTTTPSKRSPTDRANRSTGCHSRRLPECVGDQLDRVQPTDTMPLSTRAKSMMAVQSVAALLTSLLLIARAVSVLRCVNRHRAVARADAVVADDRAPTALRRPSESATPCSSGPPPWPQPFAEARTTDRPELPAFADAWPCVPVTVRPVPRPKLPWSSPRHGWRCRSRRSTPRDAVAVRTSAVAIRSSSACRSP